MSLTLTSWPPTVASTPGWLVERSPPEEGTRYHTMATQITNSIALKTIFFVLPGVCRKRIIGLILRIKNLSRIINYINGTKKMLLFALPLCLCVSVSLVVKNRFLAENPNSDQKIQSCDAVLPGNLFPLFVSTPVVGNRHLIDTALQASGLNGDFGLKAKAVGRQLYFLNELGAKDL